MRRCESRGRIWRTPTTKGRGTKKTEGVNSPEMIIPPQSSVHQRVTRQEILTDHSYPLHRDVKRIPAVDTACTKWPIRFSKNYPESSRNRLRSFVDLVPPPSAKPLHFPHKEKLFFGSTELLNNFVSWVKMLRLRTRSGALQNRDKVEPLQSLFSLSGPLKSHLYKCRE